MCMRMLLQRPEDSRCLALSLPMIPLRQGLSLTLKASELLGSGCLSPNPGITGTCRYFQLSRGYWGSECRFSRLHNTLTH